MIELLSGFQVIYKQLVTVSLCVSPASASSIPKVFLVWKRPHSAAGIKSSRVKSTLEIQIEHFVALPSVFAWEKGQIRHASGLQETKQSAACPKMSQAFPFHWRPRQPKSKKVKSG